MNTSCFSLPCIIWSVCVWLLRVVRWRAVSYSRHSHDMQRPKFVSGLPGPTGRREGLGNGTFIRQGRLQQRERRAERRREAARASDHHKSQTAGDSESGFCGHTETHQAHQGAAVTGDRPQHASHPGTGQKKKKINALVLMSCIHYRTTHRLNRLHDDILNYSAPKRFCGRKTKKSLMALRHFRPLGSLSIMLFWFSLEAKLRIFVLNLYSLCASVLSGPLKARPT